MMNNTDITNLIVKVLSKLNINEVCLCPGARNSPIISAFSKTDANLYSILDERSAGFYALGIAKVKREPVVVCCTSGTALGNLFPAIIEARMSEISLIVITADRPKRMIGKGENQTIYQNNIYGKYVRSYIDIDSTEDTKESIIAKITTIANSSLGKRIDKSLEEKGPIHINIHIDEPLFSSKSNLDLNHLTINSIKTKASNNQTLKINKNIKRPLIICGQSDLEDNSSQIIDISNKIGAPILADISSNINGNANVISFYDHFIDELEPPDLILRFGSKPQSKKLLSLIKKFYNRTYLLNSTPYKIFNDDTLTANIYNTIYEGEQFESNIDWLNLFQEKDALIKKDIYNAFNDSNFNEYIFAYQFIEKIPENSNVFVGNSLMIRAFNIFSEKSQKHIKFFSNRGASGIDGNLSTALGIATKSKKNNYLIIGDQSFMHDIGALQILTESNINLTIFIINNYGGAIFDHLPISEKINLKIFKKFIRNHHTKNFQSIIESYQLGYKKLTSMNELNDIDMNTKKVYELEIDSENSLKFVRQFSTSLSK